jgi:hypothetical protein
MNDVDKKDDAVLVALLAAILLSGRFFPNPDGPPKDSLAMLQEEKKIAIHEAQDILEMSRKACGL